MHVPSLVIGISLPSWVPGWLTGIKVQWVVSVLGLVVFGIAIRANNVALIGVARLVLKKLFGDAVFDDRIMIAHLNRALKALKGGDQATALSEFTSAMEMPAATDPKIKRSKWLRELLDAPAIAPLYMLRSWKHTVDRPEDALADAERALELDPELADARVCRGWAKLRRNEQTDAAAAYADFEIANAAGTQILEPRFAAYGRAEALRMQGQLADAIGAFSDVIARFNSIGAYGGRGLCYYASAKYDLALKDLLLAIEYGSDDAAVYTRCGLCYHRLGEYQAAFLKCEEARKHPPVTFEPLYYGALALHGLAVNEVDPTKRKDLLELARERVREARKTAEGQQVGQDMLSMMDFAAATIEGLLGNFAEAEQLRERARSALGTGAPKLLAAGLGVAYLGPVVTEAYATWTTPDDLAQTIEEAVAVVTLEPDNAEAHANLGLLYLKRDLVSDAVRSFGRALELKPSWPEPYYWRAFGYARERHWKLALNDCDRAVAMGSLSPFVFYLRSTIRGILSEAGVKEDLTRALELTTSEIATSADAAWYTPRAEVNFNLGDLSAALEDASRALALNSTDSRARLVRGAVYVQQGKYLEAIPELDAAAARSERDAAIFCVRGEAYFRLEENAAASRDLNRALELDPTSVAAYTLRGWLSVQEWEQSRERDKLDAAFADFVQVTVLDPSHAAGYCGKAWIRLKRTESGEDELDQALEENHEGLEYEPNFAFGHYARGWMWMWVAKKQPAEARSAFSSAQSAFSKAIDLGADEFGAYFGRAEAARELGNAAESIADHTTALERAIASNNRELWRIYWNRGLAFELEGRWQDAAADYRAAASGGPKQRAIPRSFLADLHAKLGLVYFELGEDVSLEQEFRAAEQLNPNSAWIANAWSGVLTYLGRLAEAIKWADKVVALEPTASYAYLNRAVTLIYMNEPVRALADLRVRLDQNPKDAAAWNISGWAHVRLGKWTEAASDCTEAISISKNDEFPWNNRAHAMFRLGRGEDALADLETLVQLRLKNFSLRFPERRRRDRTTWGATAADWSHAVDAQPGEAIPYLGRGLSRWFAGELGASLDDFQRAEAIRQLPPVFARVREAVREEHQQLTAGAIGVEPDYVDRMK